MNARLTVIGETPTASATSRIVTRELAKELVTFSYVVMNAALKVLRRNFSRHGFRLVSRRAVERRCHDRAIRVADRKDKRKLGRTFVTVLAEHDADIRVARELGPQWDESFQNGSTEVGGMFSGATMPSNNAKRVIMW